MPATGKSTDWQAKLTPAQFRSLRKKDTEAAFSGKYVHHKSDGTYCCAACQAEIFSSETKFDSGTGWPSFYDVKNRKNVVLAGDLSHGMKRTEVKCATCGSHLGHVFPDGPQPTGQRYCINSLALDFKAKPLKE
jgi:peptide-methionine (R)-S-oxide reductase